MKQPNRSYLIGVFRPRRNGPGFGIPVFEHFEMYWVQQTDENDYIVEFTMCDANHESLRSIPNSFVQNRSVEIGQSALYSFEMADGKLIIGPKKMLEDELRANITALRETPFVFDDVANFLADEQLKKEASEMCQMVISQTKIEAQKEEFREKSFVELMSKDSVSYYDISVAELQQKLDRMKDELFNLRVQLATGQLENPMRIREVKRNMSRIKTIVRERQEIENKASS